MSDTTVWFNRTPFCAACGEVLGTEEADWGCFACGGEGFNDDYPEDDHDYEPDFFTHPTEPQPKDTGR